eukprot:jgi/Bigna1/91227/estExt_fgenesh1_pg.C_930046
MSSHPAEFEANFPATSSRPTFADKSLRERRRCRRPGLPPAPLLFPSDIVPTNGGHSWLFKGGRCHCRYPDLPLGYKMSVTGSCQRTTLDNVCGNVPRNVRPPATTKQGSLARCQNPTQKSRPITSRRPRSRIGRRREDGEEKQGREGSRRKANFGRGGSPDILGDYNTNIGQNGIRLRLFESLKNDEQSDPGRSLPLRVGAYGVARTRPSARAVAQQLMGAGGVGLFSLAGSQREAMADEPETSIFYGTAFPPGTYGGYDPDAKNKAVYTFEFPAGWKTDPPSKVEKGTKGIDGRVFNPSVAKKGQQAFVIVLSRAGEDNKSFKLKDTESTFSGFVIADPDLQVALENADEVKQSSRTVGGLDFFDYEIVGAGNNYFSSITVNNEGKLFALFVKSPQSLFNKEKAALRKIVDTFQLTGR